METMSNNKSSSIDFFWNQIPEILPFTVDTETAVKLWGAFEQAKAMHKEEIGDAYFLGYGDHQTLDWHDLDEYYNETFGGKDD